MSSISLATSASAACPFFFNQSCRYLQSFFQCSCLWQKWHTFNEPGPFFPSPLSFLPVTTKLDPVYTSWFGLFLISLDKRVEWPPPRWEFPYRRVWWWRYDHMTLEENWEVLTPCPPRRSWHQQLKALMTLLKKFRYSSTAVPSFMRSPYSCFLRYSLLKRLFVIYNIYNLDCLSFDDLASRVIHHLDNPFLLCN